MQGSVAPALMIGSRLPKLNRKRQPEFGFGFKLAGFVVLALFGLKLPFRITSQNGTLGKNQTRWFKREVGRELILAF